MSGRTGLVADDRTEWPEKNAVRHKLHCADCGLRVKVAGGPTATIDQLVEDIHDAHAHICQPK